ncbi:hypothetical protein HWV62_13156 [Athelia sp. TMB]|nr:hypothetical protein HWV62_13156 [Athelia sp. TMB]
MSDPREVQSPPATYMSPMLPLDVCSSCNAKTAVKPPLVLQSPVPNVLDSYSFPSAEESKLIHATLSQIAAELSELDKEIIQMEGVLDELRRNRDDLQLFSNRHKNALNHPRRLPAEILGEIFIRWQLAAEGSLAVTPALVCQHWRAVAMATSELWRTFRFTSLTTTELDVEMTSRWLGRSRGQLLNINLTGTEVDAQITNIANQPPFSMLIEHSDRWKDLRLYIPCVYKAPAPQWLRTLPRCWPSLRSLEIGGGSYEPFVDFPDSQFRDAPLLRAVSFTRRVFTTIPQLPWSQLTHCTLLGASGIYYLYQECHEVLLSCPALIKCEMQVDGNQPFPSSLCPIDHANLSIFSFGSWDGRNLPLFWDLLTLPALSEVVAWGKYLPAACLVSLVARSSCSLTSLMIQSETPEEDDPQLIGLLRLTPRLNKLEVYHHSALVANRDGALIVAMTSNPENSGGDCSFLPFLTSLNLSISSGFNMRAFAKLVLSRYQLGVDGPCRKSDALLTQLRFVELDFRAVESLELVEFSEETHGELQRMHHDGLVMTFYDELTRKNLDVGALYQKCITGSLVPGRPFGQWSRRKDADDSETDRWSQTVVSLPKTVSTSYIFTQPGHSPIAELLGTFAAPTPSECTIIRDKIQQICVDISTLDSEIERVEAILERLRHNRSSLQKLTNGHHNVLNPTRRLPVEILGEIFVQLQEMSGGRSIAPTQVCRQWREVAIGTSRLWNCIKVPYHYGRAAADAEMVTLWLQRSGGQPLDITLVCESSYGKENPAFDAAVNGQAHRWKVMKLHVKDAIASFLRNIPEDLPMLETLHLSGRTLGVTAFANFKHASALRFLTLNGRLSSQMPLFPWAQLTKCSLLREGGYTCQDGYHVLSQASNLQAYKMELQASYTAPDVHSPPDIRLEHLLSLDIDIIAGTNVRHLLDSLTLPALTNLRIVESFKNGLPEHTASMITRSHCTLKQLSFGTENDAFTHNQLLNIFTLTPMLAELELTCNGGAGLDKSLLTRMIHYPDHVAEPCCLLPQLASIKLHINWHLCYEELASFLLMRRGPAPCESGAVASQVQLRTVALIIWSATTASGRRAHHLPDQTYEDFLKVRNSGLDLYILEGTSRLELEDYFVPGEEEDDSEDEDDEDSGLYDDDMYMRRPYDYDYDSDMSW